MGSLDTLIQSLRQADQTLQTTLRCLEGKPRIGSKRLVFLRHKVQGLSHELKVFQGILTDR